MSERKYRQSGYMDEPRDAPQRSAGPVRPREPALGPRGRGLGMPTATVMRCAVCGAEQQQAIQFDSVCLQCGRDLHTCTHCSYFDTSAHNECRQPIPQRISNKTQRNQCELFTPKLAREQAKEPGRAGDARAAFDALFKL